MAICKGRKIGLTSWLKFNESRGEEGLDGKIQFGNGVAAGGKGRRSPCILT
jgi:hypothetical protein